MDLGSVRFPTRVTPPTPEEVSGGREGRVRGPEDRWGLVCDLVLPNKQQQQQQSFLIHRTEGFPSDSLVSYTPSPGGVRPRTPLRLPPPPMWFSDLLAWTLRCLVVCGPHPSSVGPVDMVPPRPNVVEWVPTHGTAGTGSSLWSLG